jgi:hypothetical protein
MTRALPVPGLTRDLCRTHEAPDQVRGGVCLFFRGGIDLLSARPKNLRRFLQIPSMEFGGAP